jgi:rhodanese-related sulfurtransferase
MNNKKIIRLSLFFLALMVTISCTSSCAKDINAEDLKKMTGEDARLLIVDTRTEYEYKLGHIPKAINISEAKFYMLDTLLPKEKDTPLVFYCRGTG